LNFLLHVSRSSVSMIVLGEDNANTSFHSFSDVEISRLFNWFDFGSRITNIFNRLTLSASRGLRHPRFWLVIRFFFSELDIFIYRNLSIFNRSILRRHVLVQATHWSLWWSLWRLFLNGNWRTTRGGSLDNL
jgi:hypothetical protein